MSDLLTPVTDDGDEDSRRRAALKGLLALVVAAVLVVGLVLLLVGLSGGGGQHNRRVVGIDETIAPTVSATSAAKTSASASANKSTSQSAPSTSVQPKPTSTANPCPTPAPCGVPGDAGGAVAAVNAFRTSHGLPAVPGTASAQAVQCALQQGNGPSCAPHYAWQPVATQDGPKAVSLIAGRSSGSKWLLDPAISSISVGWAYAGGQYECAILKVG